ncbi:cotranscriptional regulator FAM172A [Anguilla anguilla]|uniref:cotranscriptional regulator FAM172A n=1 Tax=Anguilla anguilla TaxID=7936 RepID=UPI0015A96A4E|nr:cotranscriptional regulator FAM172A [Anguilla anguilla]
MEVLDSRRTVEVLNGRRSREVLDSRRTMEVLDDRRSREVLDDWRSREELDDRRSREVLDGRRSREVLDGRRSGEKELDGGTGSDAPLGFHYRFDGEGRLVRWDTREPFLFRFRRGDGSRRREEEQEALGCYITQHVYRLLEEQCGLRRVALPPPGRAPVFLSQGALASSRPLLVLVQDRGTVRSGQWSWQGIARDGVGAGSQIPYVQRALQERWGVALLNPNEGGASPEEHVRHAWDGLLAGAAAGQVAVVTHGYGGLAFVDLLSRRPQELQRRVCAVAFIDSAHNLWHQPLGGAARDWLKAHSRKWVLSSKPANRSVGSLKADCPQLSAGTLDRHSAPASCMDAVFRYVTKALRSKPPPFGIITRSKSRPPGGGARPQHANANQI